MDVVFHCSVGARGEQTHALANVENLLDAREDATAVFVANGDGVFALTASSKHTPRVEALADRGVSFRACSNSLRTRGIDEGDLAAVVATVPAGVGELARLQAAGYGYLKVP
ncbi:MAG: DsrE family protein [Halalkalicoccus sp.]